jgi:hypothetical protein
MNLYLNNSFYIRGGEVNMKWQTQVLLRKKMVDKYDFAKELEIDDFEALVKIMEFVIKDMGEDAGMNFLTDCFEYLEKETLKIWLELVCNALKEGDKKTVFSKAIGFLLKEREELEKEKNRNIRR